MDAAELCRNSHASEDFQSAAESAFSLWSEYLIALNADDALYRDVLRPILDDAALFNALSEEEQRFARDMQRDFEAEGIHLRGADKDEMLRAQRRVSESETDWSRNIVDTDETSQEITIGPFPKPPSGAGDHFQTLSRWLSQYVPQRERVVNARCLTSTLDRRVLSPLLNSIHEPALRKALFFESVLHPQSNVLGLRELVGARQSLAHVLSQKSHTHRALLKHMHTEPAAIEEMLRTLSKAAKPAATRELQELASLQQRERESERSRDRALFDRLFSRNSSSSSNDKESLRAWDLGYYQNVARQEQSHTQTSKHGALSAAQARQRVSEYLPLDACVDGLRLVSERLFNLRMREADVQPESENWTISPSSSSSSSSSLRKFLVFDHEEVFIGTVYFDLHHRPRKFPGAAHFTVRCGCDAISWQREEGNEESVARVSSGDGPSLWHTEKQTPVVALVFHFPPPQRGGHMDSKGLFHSEKPPLLSLHDVETLFHEWGHALHSLLSRTPFQHLSGTRGGTDFIEVPSHLLEHFARDPSVMRQWARHHRTGEPLPADLLSLALDHKTSFAAIDLQHQLLLSGADQFIFGEETRDAALDEFMDPEEFFAHVLRGVAEKQRELTVLPLAPTSELRDVCDAFDDVTQNAELKRKLCDFTDALPLMNVLSHGHFVNYGGSYYSYLFAKMYAAQIWGQNFAQDPLNPSVGELIRREMLTHGSGRSPSSALEAVTKGPLDPDFYLREIL